MIDNKKYNEQKTIEMLEIWQKKYSDDIAAVLINCYYKGKLDIGSLIDRLLDDTEDQTPNKYEELKNISKYAGGFGLI